MARKRTIVGIGEAIRAEYPDRVEAAGTALLAPLQAIRLGHTGIPISRTGQDATGDELEASLRSSGLDLAHIQRDPDHPTGRLKVQTIGRVTRRIWDPYSAFDELQWDFDLSDVAPVADAIVCGLLGCRSSQARTVIERFMDEAPSALKIADLTGLFDLENLRSLAHGVLDRTDIVLLDEPLLRTLVPAAQEAAVTQLARDLCRAHQLHCVAMLTNENDAIAMTIIDPGATPTSSQPVEVQAPLVTALSPLASAVICHALLAGWSFEATAVAVQQAWSVAAASADPASFIAEESLLAHPANGAQ